MAALGDVWQSRIILALSVACFSRLFTYIIWPPNSLSDYKIMEIFTVKKWQNKRFWFLSVINRLENVMVFVYLSCAFSSCKMEWIMRSAWYNLPLNHAGWDVWELQSMISWFLFHILLSGLDCHSWYLSDSCIVQPLLLLLLWF